MNTLQGLEQDLTILDFIVLMGSLFTLSIMGVI